jgi:hypothetical protein
MPHRTDKRDYLALMGLVSNMEITFVNGINGSGMHPDAIPPVSKAFPSHEHGADGTSASPGRAVRLLVSLGVGGLT